MCLLCLSDLIVFSLYLSILFRKTLVRTTKYHQKQTASSKSSPILTNLRSKQRTSSMLSSTERVRNRCEKEYNIFNIYFIKFIRSFKKIEPSKSPLYANIYGYSSSKGIVFPYDRVQWFLLEVCRTLLPYKKKIYGFLPNHRLWF